MTNARKSGAPKRWLMLRGLTRERRHWNRFPEVLKSSLPDVEPFYLDLPGTGASWKLPAPRTIQGNVDMLREQWLELREAQGPGEWGLLGFSLGGMVAMNWVDRYPQDFGRLILLNTSAAGTSNFMERMRLSSIPKLIGAVVATDVADRERTILSICANHPEVISDELVNEWARFQADSPVSRTTLFRQLLAAILYKPPTRLEIPVLLLASHQDRLVNPGCSIALAQRLSGKLEMHPTAGHEITLDDPEWVADRVASWFAGD